jgi:hypothetical protein
LKYLNIFGEEMGKLFCFRSSNIVLFYFDPGLPDFSRYKIPKRKKYTKWS